MRKVRSNKSVGLTEGLTDLRSEDQKTRFPNIPLPFGEAYYKALAKQEELC